MLDPFLFNFFDFVLVDIQSFVDKNDKPRTVVLDYGGANIAKELHVGHLRCNIGEAIRRLYNVFGDNMKVAKLKKVEEKTGCPCLDSSDVEGVLSCIEKFRKGNLKSNTEDFFSEYMSMTKNSM